VDGSGNLRILHSFGGALGSADLSTPEGILIQGSDADFYGTAGEGSSVYKIDTSGNMTPLSSFSETQGATTQAPLLQGKDGNFYGTTYTAGVADYGMAFKMDPSGHVTVLHIFSGGPSDGFFPRAGLVQGKDGNLYGTTQKGGTANFGVIFRLSNVR
jgi:uncharacterized repeat protein (TIGR03803 family)